MLLLRVGPPMGRLLHKLESRWPAALYTTGFCVLFEFAEMFDSVRMLAVQLFKLLRRML